MSIRDSESRPHRPAPSGPTAGDGDVLALWERFRRLRLDYNNLPAATSRQDEESSYWRQALAEDDLMVAPARTLPELAVKLAWHVARDSDDPAVIRAVLDGRPVDPDAFTCPRDREGWQLVQEAARLYVPKT